MTSFVEALAERGPGRHGESAAARTRPSAQRAIRPPRWKLATLTWLGVFPVVTAMLALGEPLLDPLPLVVRTFAVTAVVAPAMVFLVMPALTRMFRSWLEPPRAGRERPASLSPDVADRRCTARARRGLVLATPFLVPLMLTSCDAGGDGAAEAAVVPPPPPVTVATPLLEQITEWREFTGRFEAVERVEVRARVSGYVQSVDFLDGALVERGQTLFVIDPRPYEAAVEEARARLASAEARVALARAELDRAASLVERETVSRSTYDQRLEEKRAAEAAVAMEKAALRQAELDLGFTRVRAPITGRVSSHRVDVGALVTGGPSATLLTNVVALDPIYLVFEMSEADLLGHQRAVLDGKLPSARDHATDVEVRLPDEEDGQGWPRRGTLNFLDNRIDANAGAIRARAVVPNPDHFIMPGQFGHLRLPDSREYEAMLVPESAILADRSDKVVMTVSKAGVVEPRVIRPGPSYPGGLRVVRGGLGPAERIVINGLMRARPGAMVTAQPGTIESPANATAQVRTAQD